MFTKLERSKTKTTFPRFYRMPDIPGHYFARPAENRRFGQAFLILFLMKLSNFWHALEPSHPFGLGDIAMHDGSTMKDHVSHDNGTGVDIYIIARNREQRPAHEIIYKSTENCETQPCYDFDRTLKLTNLISTISLDWLQTQQRRHCRRLPVQRPRSTATIPHRESDPLIQQPRRPYSSPPGRSSVHESRAYETHRRRFYR